MRACTSISNRLAGYRLPGLVLLLNFFCLPAFATLDPPREFSVADHSSKTSHPEEDDYSNTPFTEYGEFNTEEDEEADTKFFQYGRFFGISLGLGVEGATGNRGGLWQGGFPLIDFKLHYWFDFNLAMDMGFYVVPHFYETNVGGLGHVDVNMSRLGVDLKYYFDTKNLTSTISFSNPFILMGVGSYSKTENSVLAPGPNSDSGVGIGFGGGLEFAIKPRSAYFQVEGKVHIVKFKDTFTQTFASSGIADLTGLFYTVTGNILFTW